MKGQRRVELRNWLFSDAKSYKTVVYDIQKTAVAEDIGDWRRGYWQECSWRNGPLELGTNSEITRRFASQYSDFSKDTDVRKRSHDFDAIGDPHFRKVPCARGTSSDSSSADKDG